MLALRNAKIDNFNVVIDRQHNIVGLDVPMGYVVSMGVIQCLRTPLHYADDVVHRKQLIRFAVWPESPETLHVFHCDVGPSLEISGVVNTQNVRVIERANDLSLVQEHLLRYFTAKLDFARRVYLYGYLTDDDRIVAHVNGPHATTTGNAQDRVLT